MQQCNCYGVEEKKKLGHIIGKENADKHSKQKIFLFLATDAVADAVQIAAIVAVDNREVAK